MAGFMYDLSGRDVWYAGSLVRQAAGTFSGDLHSYSGGSDRVTSEPVRPPTANRKAVSVVLHPISPTSARLSLYAVPAADPAAFRPPPPPPPRTIEIVRFPISTPAFQSPTFPELNGWWWNSDNGGHGYFIEMQGNSVFAVAYTYAADGEPRWYVSSGSATSVGGQPASTATALTDAVVAGELRYFRGGQSLFGSYQPPTSSVAVGDLVIRPTSATTAIMRFPSGASVQVQRFAF